MRTNTPLRFAWRFAGSLWRKRLEHLVLHVTNRCNYRCRHCFVDFAPKPALQLADFQKLARELGPLFWLDIGGGEPFLRDELPEIVNAFDARVVHIPTNGSLGERTVEMVRAMHVRPGVEFGVALSLDGLQPTHDRIRGAPGSHDQVWETFERLRQVDGLSVYINTVLTRDNQHEMPEFMEQVWRRRPDFHAVTLLRGDPLDPRTALPPVAELRALAPRIFAISERYGSGGRGLLPRMARNYHRYLWNLSLATLERQTQVIDCLAGRTHLVVWSDGQVASCEMLPPVGNLLEQGIDEILAGPALAAQRDGIRRKQCHCTHNCALFTSIMFNPRSLPHLLHQPLR